MCSEQVKIPHNKPMIYLKGGGKRNTYVVWGSHKSIETDATFISEADEVVVKSITFVVRTHHSFNIVTL